MTRVIVKFLILDRYNLEHIKKHGVTENEVRLAGENFVYHRKGKRGTYLAISRVGLRMVTLVIVRKAPGKYYLITARDSNKKERRYLYVKEKNQNS